MKLSTESLAKLRSRLNTDRLVSLSAMLVGISSLILIIYQTQLTRQAQNASVLPYLMIVVISNEGGTYLSLRNDGVGPALIEEVRIRYRGQVYEEDPFEFYTRLQPEAASRGLSVDNVVAGRLIPAGHIVQMIGRGGAENVPTLREFLQLFDVAEVPDAWYEALGLGDTEKAVIEIDYTSVFGDRWQTVSNRIAPERL